MKQTLTIFGAFLSTLAFAHGGDTAESPSPSALHYSTSWLGNSFGGGKKWVQDFAENMFVNPDGTVFVASKWDEGGHEFGIYRDGDVVGGATDTHGWGTGGGRAVAANNRYLFIGHSQGNERGKLTGPQYPPKGITWYGISRRKLDGTHAPFDGGKARFGDFVILHEAAADAQLAALAADEHHLFACDPIANLVRIFDVETMAETGSFAVDQPRQIALDGKGNLWLIAGAPVRIVSYTAEGKLRDVSVPLAKDVVPTALAFDPQGRLLVADNGPKQQVAIFEVSAKVHQVDSLGEENGIFGGAHPGKAAPLRFGGLTGVGADKAGNVYVSCNLPPGGTVLRSFSPRREMRWELLGLEFVDVADADPASDGKDVFTCRNRYSMDYSKPAGQEWHWVARTVDPFRYPQDLRLHEGNHLQCGTEMRRLGGRSFLVMRGMWQNLLCFYRVEDERCVPSVVLAQNPYHSPDGFVPPGQPEKGRWIWMDANGDGQMESSEYQEGPGPGGEFWASNVDSAGDIWQGDQRRGIWRWHFQGLDQHGTPKYSPAAVEHYEMPAPLTNLLRTEYLPESDTMYLTGQTADHKITGGEWGTVGTEVIRYDHWSKQPEMRYRAVLPYEDKKTSVVSFGVAGDLFFAVTSRQAEVFVYDNRTGQLLGTMKPGPEVGSESGWVDFRDAIRAIRRQDGNYVIFVEEDWKAKTIVYRLDDPLRK